MAVEILEGEGRARYPIVGEWAAGRHAAFAEGSRRPFEIRLANREGEMVAWELTVVLLKHDHPGGAPSAKEQPLSAFVSKSDRETENISVERLGPLELSHRNRDLVETSDRQHRSPPKKTALRLR